MNKKDIFGFNKEFRKIVGFGLHRAMNDYRLGKDKNDYLFEHMSRLFLKDPKIIKKIQKIAETFLKYNLSQEEVWALLGISYYLQEDYHKSAICFFNCVYLCSDNIDNWIDLTFALRHEGCLDISNKLFFNLESFILAYKKSNFRKLNHSNLRRLARQIDLG